MIYYSGLGLCVAGRQLSHLRPQMGVHSRKLHANEVYRHSLDGLTLCFLPLESLGVIVSLNVLWRKDEL